MTQHEKMFYNNIVNDFKTSAITKEGFRNVIKLLNVFVGINKEK